MGQDGKQKEMKEVAVAAFCEKEAVTKGEGRAWRENMPSVVKRRKPRITTRALVSARGGREEGMEERL